jgi:methylase of polypeptide subunit release factors
MSIHTAELTPQGLPETVKWWPPVNYKGLQFVIPKGVFCPGKGEETATRFFTDALLAEGLHGDMIEVGCGCGLTGLSILEQCNLKSLTATDTNPFAVACTLKNSELLNLADRVSVHQGDVFGPIPPAHQADIIYWNCPWIYREASPDAPLSRHFYDPNYQSIERYIHNASSFLKPDGRLFLGFGRGGNPELLTRICGANNYDLSVIASLREKGEMLFTLYELVEPRSRIYAFPAKPMVKPN